MDSLRYPRTQTTGTFQKEVLGWSDDNFPEGPIPVIDKQESSSYSQRYVLVPVSSLETGTHEYPSIFQMEIYSLPSDEYELCQPVEVMLKIYPDEVLALIPELELYGEGATEFEAVNDLKIEIIDLVRELEEISDEELGTDPKMWKKTLATLVKKCR